MAEPYHQSPDSLTDKPPRRKRRWALGLKIFAGILLALGAASGWIIWRGYRQLAAIELIERSNYGGVPGSVKCEPVGPDWLRKQLGAKRMRMFDRVTEVTCCLYAPNPQLFREVGRWSDVTKLTIFLGSLEESETKSLQTETDRRQLLSTKAEQFRETENGFRHLHNLTRLKLLVFQGPMVNDRDLEWIERQSDLEFLIFDLVPITDKTARHFSSLTKLRSLRVVMTLITDDGLSFLSEIKSLETLNLSGTQVTDSGLSHLHNLTNLRLLILDGTQVTAAGIEELERALPQLRVPPPSSQLRY